MHQILLTPMIVVVLHTSSCIQGHRVLSTLVQLVTDDGGTLILIKLVVSHEEELLVGLMWLANRAS